MPVSRETGEKLEAFVALIEKWQVAENLVSPGTLPVIWTRHIADCLQLLPLMPTARQWLDVGSGAGLPGLVVAIAGGEGTHVDLIESNQRRCAFLRQAIRETGAPATVHEGRAEDLLADWKTPVDRIIARAVARLDQLLKLAAPLMLSGVPAAFHKGRGFQREIEEATQSWDFDLVQHQSRIGGGGVILEITRLRRAPKQSLTSG